MTSSRPGDRVPAGIAFMVVATLIFGLINVVVKWQAEANTIITIVFFRNLFALLPTGWLVARQVGWAGLRPRRIDLHLVRGTFGFASLVLLFWSFDLMPLADAVALSFASPLFLTALSVPVLREHVGPWRWGAVVVGLVGVVIMARPTGDVQAFAAGIAIASAVLFAVAMLTVRQMSATENSAVITFYYTLICTVLAGLMLPWSWTMPSLVDFAALFGIGLAGGISQYLMTRSYALAPASATAPFNYVTMLWAVIFGWAIWGEVPGISLLLGGALVVGSGLVILWRESVRRGVR